MNRSGVKELDMPPTSMGDRIAGARAKLGLGLREAARRCQIDPTKLADAEAGKDSRASTVAAIARGLCVSADWLLGVVPGDDVIAIASTGITASKPDHEDFSAATPPTLDRHQSLAAWVADIESVLTRTVDLVVTLGIASGIPQAEQAARDLQKLRDPK